MTQQLPPILQVGDILISSDILTERFCCDLSVCKGQCCIEGDLVTSIVGGKNCVFTYYDDIEDFTTKQPIHDCCLCALEKAFRNGHSSFCKPISCALYPIRVKTFSDGTIALNYHKWNVCKDAVKKGLELDLPVYRFLEGPLVRRFGQEWYNELCTVANELKAQGYI